MRKAKIRRILGKDVVMKEDDDEYTKCSHEWQFWVAWNSRLNQCALWDWKGLSEYNQYSAYGPPAVLQHLFGSSYKK
jgi:hypothetical protein